MPSPAQLKLGHAEFSYLSALTQGVDTREAWSRYMLHRGSLDARRIRALTRMLLDVLRAAAKRHGDPTLAAVLQRDPARIRTPEEGASPATPPLHPPASLPSLEDFRATLADPDFYSEAELTELWAEQFSSPQPTPGQPASTTGATSAVRALKRKARLVQRQIAALRRLERLLAAKPVPQDVLAAWLEDSLCTRLKGVGVLRLQELQLYIKMHGYRWYRKVPRLGEQGAQRLIAWLCANESSLGPVAPTSLVPRSQLDVAAHTPAPDFGLVPLERIRVPSTLNGHHGRNRARPEACSLEGVHDDYAAVCAWLNMYKPGARVAVSTPTRLEGPDALGGMAAPARSTLKLRSEHTWRAYRKEAERILLWALFSRRKALSDLAPADCAEYADFLAAPGPEWVGSKRAQRWSAEWRPFEGPLSEGSRQTAIVIVRSLFGWLNDIGYLAHNPWRQVPGVAGVRKLRRLRSLSDQQWQLLRSFLGARAERGRAGARLNLLVTLAHATGLREAELAAAKVGWLFEDADEDGEMAWGMVAVGKGNKEREVPVPRRIAEALRRYLAGKGVGDTFDEMPKDLPLFSTLDDPWRPLSAARVYALVKDGLAACADELEPSQPKDAERIRQASPHWLRHTHGRQWVEAGLDRGMLRDRLGHASIVTTGIYDRSDAQRQRAGVEKVFG